MEEYREYMQTCRNCMAPTKAIISKIVSNKIVETIPCCRPCWKIQRAKWKAESVFRILGKDEEKKEQGVDEITYRIKKGEGRISLGAWIRPSKRRKDVL